MSFIGVEENGDWSLMCPNECPGLDVSYGEAFEELYIRYEKAGKARKTVSAQKLWFSILDTQIESGMPFMCYKGRPCIKILIASFAHPFDRRSQ